MAAGVLGDGAGDGAGSCEALERALECQLLAGNGNGGAGGRSARMAAALWELARRAIARREEGSAWIRFAQVVAAFGEEGGRDAVMRQLWESLAGAAGRHESAFREAVAELRGFGLAEVREGRIGMPRILREGVSAALGEDGMEALADEIGAALARCGAMRPVDWLPLAGVAGAIRHFPREGLAGSGRDGGMECGCNIQVLLLRRNPKFAGHCDWSLLSAHDWSLLLAERPEFAGRCPPEMLQGLDWRWLLKRQPGLADRCPWQDLDGRAWAEILSAHPQYAERPEWGRRRKKRQSAGDGEVVLHPRDAACGPRPDHVPKSVEGTPRRKPAKGKLHGGNWVELLLERPEFAECCPWGKLDGSLWAILLRERPEFAGHCAWKKLRGGDWADLLEKQPQFADRCDWKKLRGGDWPGLLRAQPQFAGRCDWDALDGGDWVRFLTWGLVAEERVPWEKLRGGDWAGLLAERPGYAERCAWAKLDVRDWTKLLCRQPRFADRCPDAFWPAMNPKELLEAQPRLAERVGWTRLDGLDWASLLRTHPEFADRCEWRKLGGRDWSYLLCHQPQFAERCPWGLLDGAAWAELLGVRPEFEGMCDWKSLGEEDWKELLRDRPGFAAKKREMDGLDSVAAAAADGGPEDAGALLERYRPGIAARMKTARPTLREGDEVGEWTVKGLIGRGGSAEVFAAVRRRDGLAGVLKVQLPADQAHHRDAAVARARFAREAHFLAGNPGRSFPAFYGQGETGGRLWMALERLEDFPLPEGEEAVKRYLLEVGEAVAALHAMGWVHRDIKLKNSLRRADGHAVLADFGLITPLGAEQEGSAGRLSVVDGRAMGVGTPGFAAPEQLGGEAATVRGDVYALGILANECFHRAPPRSWQEIVLRAASGVRELRYASVEEMMEAVGALRAQ